jgi:uncharacterized protein YifE (UPF0438 family)
MESFEALSWWHGIKSPMILAVLCGFLLMFAAVAYMMPSSGTDREPEPEDRDEENQLEPSTELQSSRYESNSRSLGMKFPGVFADATFRAEGMLVWLYFRCQARVRRENNSLVNAERMNGLAEFIHMFMDHPSDEQHTHMKESLSAMTDLTDDERSPRFQFSEQQVMEDVGQAFQGYQAGMSDESENATETEEQRYHRYCQSTLSEVSDPDTWMEVHHEAEDERYHRYMVSERHEVSAVELWDEQQDQMVRENDEIARGELVDENEL